jgi:N-glycosylase/DNA lyase
MRSHLIRRDDVEREAFNRLPLVFGRLLGAPAEDNHLCRIEQRDRRSHFDELRSCALLAEHVRHPHPVERALVHAFRRVQIGVRIEVEQPGRLTTFDMPGDRADPDRTVAAQHQRRLAIRYRRRDPAGGALHDLNDGSKVLGAWILPIRPPAPDLAIPAVADIDPGISEQLEQPRVAQRRGPALLTGRERTSACRNSNQGKWLPAHRIQTTSSVQLTIDPSDIASPYDFGFQLRHYVIAPEARDGPQLVEIVPLGSGKLVKIDISSSGTVEEPQLELKFSSDHVLSRTDVGEARRLVVWRLGLEEDLRPFYAAVVDDPVLSASIEHNYGAKGKSAFSMFDAVIDVICAQNTAFRRLYTMRANLAAAFGEPLVTAERVYHASPTPEDLAAAPLEAIRACGVGYRDRYIKGVAEAVVRGFDLESLQGMPRDEARRELMKLPGVGPYTADLGLIIGARRQDALFVDVFLREVLRTFYFDGEQVADATLFEFAEQRWGPYQGYAWLYLTTNTEAWARPLGVAFRLKSGALSDPDDQ